MSCYGKKCIDVIAKILQVLVIVAIIFMVASFVVKGIQNTAGIGIFAVIYILYLISEFCSSTASFLCNKTTEQGIRNIMTNLVQTPPTIEFYCECYHYETHTVVYSPPKKGGGRKGGGARKAPRPAGGHRTGGAHRAGGGHHRVSRQTRRITTYRETAYFPYYSSRDVSGLFEINNSREDAMGKVYVKLELNPEINFADELSYMDYENFRSHFYNRNRPRDQYMTYRETRYVKGLNNFNLVCIRDEQPCGINICMFILFTIIPLAEFYKCYIDSYCLDQSFRIRKLISTRYDLNLQQQYEYFTPSINVPNQTYAFEPNNYNYINNDFQVQKPTNDEISQAAIYKDKIPNYQCVSYTSINDQIKVAVVQDDPAYCSVNINEAPPPNCQDVGPQPGNNMVNQNANMNFNNNVNVNINNGLDSNNNLNNNMYGNNYNNVNSNNNFNNMNNFNNNQYIENVEDYSDGDEGEAEAYSGV